MQTESDVGTEMVEIGSHRGIRSLLLIFIRKDLDAILDIIGYILLFLSVLLRPFYPFYRIIGYGLGRFCLLGACQRHGYHLILFTFKQYFRGSHQPYTRLGCINQGYKKTGIHPAGLQKQSL